jgi:hypothetical protein
MKLLDKVGLFRKELQTDLERGKIPVMIMANASFVSLRDEGLMIRGVKTAANAFPPIL